MLRLLQCDPRTGLTLGENTPHSVYVTLGGQLAPDGWEGIVDACHGPIHHVPSALATVLSFHPVKHVCAGEGGAVLTDVPELATRVYALRDSGRLDGRCRFIGTNGHMDEMSAALAHSQLTRFHQGVAIRQSVARSYDIGLAGLETVEPVPHDPMSARHLYQVLVPLGEQPGFRERL